jgi:hypothetical protein
MYTADIVRRQQIEGYMRLREQQQGLLVAMLPFAKAWGEKMREVYPDLYPPQSPAAGQA